MKKITFTENFKNNQNSWPQEVHEDFKTGVTNSTYHIYHNRPGNSYAIYQGFHQILQKKAFSLELSMKVSGESDPATAQAGLLFGLSIDNQERWTYDLFAIGRSGFYVGTHKGADDRWEAEADWLEHPAIKNTPGEYNVLRIEKFDQSIDQGCYYFINDELVHQSSSLPLCGFLQGIWVCGKIDVAFDLFKVSYISN